MGDKWLDFYRIYKMEEALKSKAPYCHPTRVTSALKKLEGKNFDILDLCEAMDLPTHLILKIGTYYYSNL